MGGGSYGTSARLPRRRRERRRAGSSLAAPLAAGSLVLVSGAPHDAPRVNEIDCHVLGLTMSIVGVVAFANSIAFRRPRAVIEEFFGESRPSLRQIKDHVLRKVHTYFGLGFLLAGFLLQIVAVLPFFPRADTASPFLPFAILGVLALATVFE